MPVYSLHLRNECWCYTDVHYTHIDECKKTRSMITKFSSSYFVYMYYFFVFLFVISHYCHCFYLVDFDRKLAYCFIMSTETKVFRHQAICRSLYWTLFRNSISSERFSLVLLFISRSYPLPLRPPILCILYLKRWFDYFLQQQKKSYDKSTCRKNSIMTK